MSQTLKSRFPTIGQLFAKTASTVSDPGPDSGHPAHVDPDNMSVQTGETITDSAKELKKVQGETSVDSAAGPVTDQAHPTHNTEVGKDGSELPGLEPNATSPDFGADSNHPASAGNEKYASCTTIGQVYQLIEQDLSNMINKLAASPEFQTGQQDPFASTDDQDLGTKVAGYLTELLPAESQDGQASVRERVTSKIAQYVEPFVQDAIIRADRLAAYCKLAEADPAAAAAMMEADPEALMAGGAPSMAGGDPAMAGGDPSMAGGGEEEQILQVLEELSAELGIPVEQLLQLLGEGQGGGGDPGAGPVGDPPG